MYDVLIFFIFNSLFQVNILTHTAEERLTKRHLESIEKMKKKHFKQDQRELFGNFQVVEEKSGNNSGGSDATISGNNLDWLEASGDGAIWDIFRRQDVLKLQEYLKKHFKEFRHLHCCPLQQVVLSMNFKLIQYFIFIAQLYHYTFCLYWW